MGRTGEGKEEGEGVQEKVKSTEEGKEEGEGGQKEAKRNGMEKRKRDSRGGRRWRVEIECQGFIGIFETLKMF